MISHSPRKNLIFFPLKMNLML